MISGAMFFIFFSFFHITIWESFLANMESQLTPSMMYFATVSQQLLTAIKHVAGDNFVFSRRVHWRIMHSAQSNCWSMNFHLYFFLILTIRLTAQQFTPVIIFLESHTSPRV